MNKTFSVFHVTALNVMSILSNTTYSAHSFLSFYIQNRYIFYLAKMFYYFLYE